MSEAIIIGWIRKGKTADCGETMKNQLLIQKLENFGVRCYQMDFKDWRKHPWVFLNLLYTMIVHRKASLIFTTSAQNVYLMMKLLKRFGWKQHTVHWVIGGTLGNKVVDGTYRPDVIGYIDWTLVESDIMVKQLTGSGVKNVLQVPNFKPIMYKPTINRKNVKLRFVFLSRIMPEKGCDYIIEAAAYLNKKGFEDKFYIDFYGKIASQYEHLFKDKITNLKNLRYVGFLNLTDENGYDILSSYDVILFPTYWIGEGFAGVFIDAFIAGVPIIASEWAHNKQFLVEGETALFVPVHDVESLQKKMRECIEGKFDLKKMSEACQREADKYNVDNVITRQLLTKIQLLKS